MVNISFRVWDFKHIMKTCGTIVDPKNSREISVRPLCGSVHSPRSGYYHPDHTSR